MRTHDPGAQAYEYESGEQAPGVSAPAHSNVQKYVASNIKNTPKTRLDVSKTRPEHLQNTSQHLSKHVHSNKKCE